MTLQVVVGGQAGSEGKGAIAAYLASFHHDGISVRVAGPNAGHTVIGRCPPYCPSGAATELPDPGPNFHASDRHPWRLRQVPVAAVSNESEVLVIAPGSEIDFPVLFDELEQLDLAGYRATERLVVDPEATVLEHLHKNAEASSGLVSRIGSTGKGIGAARAARVMRTALRVRDVVEMTGKLELPDAFRVEPTGPLLRQALANGDDILVEGTQGYLLGEHAGFYPRCTSSDCTASDFLAMAGLPPWIVPQDELEIWVVFRTYPIRVAGNSGPLRNETTWEELGLEPELTTVTRKVRRVGHWDPDAARAAMVANGHVTYRRSPVRAALTMADQVIPDLAGRTAVPDDELDEVFHHLVSQRSHDLGSLIQLVGTGPQSVIDLRPAPAIQRM